MIVTRGAPLSGVRVLLIVENLPVPPDRRVWQQCRALRDAGCAVSVISPKGRGHDRSHEVIDDIHVYRHWLPLDARGVAGFLVEYAVALFWQIVLSWRVFFTRGFDVIQACNPPDAIWIVALPFRLLFGRKFVFDHHDPFGDLFAVKFPRHKGILKIVRLFEKISIRGSHGVISTSEALRQVAIERHGKAPELVHLVRSCPDPRAFRRGAPDAALRKGASKLVVYVGVMGSQDGVDLLIRAAAVLVHQRGRSDVHFLLLGDGPEYSDLVALSRELKVDRQVRFGGFLTGAAFQTALSSADLGVCPDPCNTFNDKLSMNKVLEYMAMELPTVMFELAEGRRIAGDSAVYAGTDSDPVQLADAMLDLLDDEARRRRMGALARHRVETLFDWNDHRQVYLDAYATILNRTPSGVR